ncbi:MAG: TonB-dependent receptor plug domain-containing protein, partial [Proteobacteria bacterium]|nr:TonB-dependent receptor plug domain-containing protein [Pseudomonadota bacterium]
MKNILLSSSIVLILLIGQAWAQTVPKAVETVTIYANQIDVEGVTGAAQYISETELEKFAYTDIQRIIRQVPGVSLQIEDGYGLRPNISIRAVATERSGRITLLEDNVLIAPAPYSAPSAYYFPTAARMSAFEVVKGPAAITQGPYTIGGALNMISTPVPEEQGGQVTVEAGENATYRLHGTYGATLDNGFGYLLEAHQWQSEGFQNIARSDNDTGLNVTDYTLKLAYAPDDSEHSVE